MQAVELSAVDGVRRQARQADLFLEMEDPISDALLLADALDRVAWFHKDQGRIPLAAWEEMDAVLRALRAELARAAGAYKQAA